MITNIIVVDDFYQDAMDMRNFALSLEFSVKGNYPGQRTAPYYHQGIINSIQSILQIQITEWPHNSYTGAFQYTVEEDETWVHADFTTTWSGLVYLTPDAPLGSGTGFFRHKETGLDAYSQNAGLQAKCDSDASNWDKWQMTDYVENRFNRLVLFRGLRFHSSTNYFGESKETGRLFQTFFFNTAY